LEEPAHLGVREALVLALVIPRSMAAMSREVVLMLGLKEGSGVVLKHNRD
jgi:hypothetical protein